MAILLGVDTGGTYTDAVLLQDEDKVLATAKALTTRHDLALGVGAAIDAVLAQSGVTPDQISMASLSTTLATNALVEGQGTRVALIFIGFSKADLNRQGLFDSLKGDPVIYLSGGHAHDGKQIAPLDLDTLAQELVDVAPTVSAFAVAGQFATRNPAHEIAVRNVIRRQTGKPVSCSHDLSAKLNGPKRAMTAVLNARLIHLIDHLISSVDTLLVQRGIDAPLMVVRGDGALIAADMARDRPIETILSGPAASLVGARWLTHEKEALVSDIGGTTTDVAILHNGKPQIDPTGARVGPYRTMVEAVAMHTIGLGGDSIVRTRREGLTEHLILGPKRVLPVSLCATQWPDLVHAALDRQLAGDRSGEYDARFVVPVAAVTIQEAGLGPRETALLQRIGATAKEMGRVITSRFELSSLEKLVSRGLVLMAGVTPSDASHVLGFQDSWDKAAANKALRLFGRQRTIGGTRLSNSAEELAQRIIDRLTLQTAEILLETAFDGDNNAFGGLSPAILSRHALTTAGLAKHRGLIKLDAGLNLPVVGLGASAAIYYKAVGKRLSTKMILPKYAPVANAIGAVVGQVSVALTGAITSPSAGQYKVFLPDGPQDYNDEKEAMKALETALRTAAGKQAVIAGAGALHFSVTKDVKRSNIEGSDMFVSADIRVVASGRPRVTEG